MSGAAALPGGLLLYNQPNSFMQPIIPIILIQFSLYPYTDTIDYIGKLSCDRFSPNKMRVKLHLAAALLSPPPLLLLRHMLIISNFCHVQQYLI